MIYFIAAFVVYIIWLALYSYLSYLKFTFFLDEEKQEFIIKQGILNKESLTIRLDKIQQVNINQSLIQQIIGVYSLDIDTAGSDKKEASIKAVDHVNATLLKEKLLNRNTDGSTEVVADPEQFPAKPLFKLSMETLFKVGITSNYGASLALLGGFIYAIMEAFRNYVEAFQIKADLSQVLFGKGLSLLSVGILIGIAILIVLTTNIVRTLLKYYRFEIIRGSESLTVNTGLLTRHHTLLKAHRVQLSSFSQNYFQKKFNFLNIKVKQASFNIANEANQDHKNSDIDIPGCNEQERDEVLKMILDKLPVTNAVFIPNYRFIFLTTMLNIVIPVLIFIGVGYWFLPVLKGYFSLIIPYVIFVGTLLYFEYIHHRLFLSNDFIVKKSGIWDVTHQILEPHKIQSITTKQYFWHKKVDIGHLTLHTAAGTIHFGYGKYSEIHQMVNYWLFKLESGKKDWM